MDQQDFARGFIGAGDIILNPWDPVTGRQTGWIAGGDASAFELQAASEILERTSRGRNTAGQVIATAARMQPATLNITFAEVNQANLTLAFMGESSAINVAAGNVAADPLLMKPGVGGALRMQNIKAAGFALKAADGGAAFPADSYTVNYRLGLIFPVAGGALATAIAATGDAGLPVEATYEHGAIGGTEIKGAVRPSLRTEIKFDGVNEADGRPTIVEVWQATLTPQSGFNFLSDEWNDLQLSGRMVTPAGKTSPFKVSLPNYA